MKPERQALIIVLILAVLTVIILAIILINTKGGTSTFNYNDYEIQEIREGNYVGYKTKVFIDKQGPFFMNTRYSPKDLEDISISERLRPYLDNKTELYIHITGLNESFKGKTSIAALELNGLIERFFSVPVKYEDNIKDCSYSFNQTIVIDFRLNSKNEIYVENNCIIAVAKTEEDFIRISDRIVFHLLGIMD
nr:hypothetical protein [Candidatus Woesearchaeota archaeon]